MYAIGAYAGDRLDITFDRYSPWSRSEQMEQRLLSPLNAARIERIAADAPGTMREQAIDLANERFVVYVPAPSRDGYYALLVFIPPWNEAKIPPQWTAAFDQHAMIFVAAARSGNDANVLDRREPLALLAAQNIIDRYHVNPSRVFVGGFSGGSHVALRLALAYPDLFRGALLEAGSDPIGTTQIPLPRADVFSQFQQKSRIVYLTGREDRDHLEQDAASLRSLREWCVAGIDGESVPRLGHDVADFASFNRALTAMMIPPPDAASEQFDACRRKVAEGVALQLKNIKAALADGRKQTALAALTDLDTRYGGLAAPHSLELYRQIETSLR